MPASFFRGAAFGNQYLYGSGDGTEAGASSASESARDADSVRICVFGFLPIADIRFAASTHAASHELFGPDQSAVDALQQLRQKKGLGFNSSANWIDLLLRWLTSASYVPDGKAGAKESGSSLGVDADEPLRRWPAPPNTSMIPCRGR